MTNLEQSCSKSGLGLSCPCDCDRCIITQLSKLDRNLLPKLNEPKYRNCEPCRQKYDLILRRGSKQPPLTHQKEKPTMVMGEELVPLADNTSTTDQLSIPKEPVIESPGGSSSYSDVDVTTKSEAKVDDSSESTLLNPPEKTLLKPSSSTPIGFAADTKGITIPLLPNKVITCDLDTGHIETSDIQVDEMDNIKRNVKVETKLMDTTKEAPSRPSAKQCTEASGDRSPAFGRKLVSIKAKMRARSPTPANTKPCNSPKMGANLKSAGRAPSCSYRVNIRTGKSKAQPSPSGNIINKDCAVISRSNGGSRGKYTTKKTMPKTLESMGSQPVEAFMTKRNSTPARPQSGLSVKWHNSRSNSRVSSEGDSRTPWYPLRSTNRWDHYDKLEERPSTPAKNPRTKLVKAKSKVLNKGQTQAITDRSVNMEPEYTGTSSLLPRKGKQKTGKPSYFSDATFKPELRNLRSDSLVYYKLKGKMKPHVIDAPTDITPQTAGHSREHSRTHQREPRNPDIYRCSEDLWSDSERTCYVSDGDSYEYVCECICNEEELNVSKCYSNECQANLANSPTYWREERYNLGCEGCCVAPVPSCHGDHRAVKGNTCYGGSNTSVTQVIPYDGSTSTNRCSLYKTHSVDGSCWEEEYEGINVSEPCYVRGRMTVSRGPGSISIPRRDRYSYQTCFDNTQPSVCNCYAEQCAAVPCESLQHHSFRARQRVATPSASNHCRISVYS